MQPLFIGPFTQRSGVQQNVTPFMIPDEAFPNMKNAFVWRGRVQRKPGYSLLGRLQRKFTATSIGNFDSTVTSYNLITLLGITETNAQIQSGFVITIGAPDSQTLTDSGTGTLAISPVDATKIISATVNYATGVLTLTWGGVIAASAATFTGGYFPGLPAMGIRLYENPTLINEDQTVFFDTKYAYEYDNATNSFQELPSTIPSVWSGLDYQQFWTTTFQNTANDKPLLWTTNGKSTANGFVVTAISAAVAGPPSTATITTASPYTFAIGNVVVFFQFPISGGVANAVTATITGTPTPTTFTVTNPGAGVFTNNPMVSVGMVYLLSATDGIRYYDGTTWNYFTPAVDGNVGATSPIAPTSYLLGALLIVPYKNRLVVLNTVEGTTAAPLEFKQRARWSQLSLATGASATDVTNGWTSTLPGRGGEIDAATEESIISCGFVKDELIVYFERSTWKLAYTGNEIGPFTWQRINSELGADSTFSAVQFDSGLVALGNVGVHTCNGSQVQRIDEVIPDEVFNIHNGSDGPQRESGIRDFFLEIIYFAYPSNVAAEKTGVGKIFFPNKMMIYNYRNNTFSFFDDNATTLGYFNAATGQVWDDLTYFTWDEWRSSWDSGVLSEGFPSVCFGNQQGFIEKYTPLLTQNGASLMIQNIVTNASPPGSLITSPQHNLFAGQYVRLSGVLGYIGTGSYVINGVNVEVLAVIDENSFVVNTRGTGTYLGGGLITVLTQIIIPTKQFTPYWEKGKNYSLKYFDVLFDLTDGGELQTDIYIDFNTSQSMTDTSGGYVLGSPNISTAAESTNLPYYQFQTQGSQIWKRFYTVATGETFQIQFSFQDPQMIDQVINNSGVVIHAMNLFFEESGEFY